MSTKKNNFWLNGIHSKSKVGLSLMIGIATAFLLKPLISENLICSVLGYCGFGLTLLIFYWISFYRTPIKHLQTEAQKEDNGRAVISLMVLLSILGSMLAIFLIFASKNENPQNKILHIVTAILGITIAWMLLHTLYTVKYAHLYYGNSSHEKGFGLSFPEGENYMPDFMDFVYFSFVLGMTFQVSDVSINAKEIRHIALWHSLISFVFNAVIIAATINLIAGLGN